jgi:small subunit ribosomal protein S6
LRNYELVYILQPELEEEEEAANAQRIEQLITSNGGQISETKPWGRRRLAYPLGGYRDGRYTLVRFELDPQSIQELERNLKLREEIIRYLLVSTED